MRFSFKTFCSKKVSSSNPKMFFDVFCKLLKFFTDLLWKTEINESQNINLEFSIHLILLKYLALKAQSFYPKLTSNELINVLWGNAALKETVWVKGNLSWHHLQSHSARRWMNCDCCCYCLRNGWRWASAFPGAPYGDPAAVALVSVLCCAALSPGWSNSVRFGTPFCFGFGRWRSASRDPTRAWGLLEQQMAR